MTTATKSALLSAMVIGLCSLANAQPARRYIDTANMDLSYRPGDNFFLYANGKWIQNNPVPAKETRWGSFNQLRDLNINQVKTVLQKSSADKSAPKGSVTRRVADFYMAGMDSITISKRGYAPIKNYLKDADDIDDVKSLLKVTSEFRTNGIGSAMFGFFVGQDRKNVEVMIPQLSQGGTTLPDRDYYLKNDGRYPTIQEAYKKYIATLFQLTGYKDVDAKAAAATVYELEKKMAEMQMSRVEMRDPYKTYNKFSLQDLTAKTPGLDWKEIFSLFKIKGEDSVLVNNPSFFTGLADMIKTVPMKDWRTYVKWNVLKSSATLLSEPFVAANFEYNQVLTGQKERTPRWQQISSLTDGSIPDLLGQLYVKDYFKPEAKARMQELVSNLRTAYAIRIRQLDWMSDDTKQKALAKLAAFNPKIGYPDEWRNYEGLVIEPQKFYENVKNVGAWNYNFMISQLGKPVDRKRFGMSAPTVNAYYSATLNEIVFPAGILQFPFFDPNADDAVNYGGIGAVIGHEMSHGFDDNGSKYDADGTLRNWWTEEDRAKFDARTLLLGKQFDAYTVQDSIHVNGKLTMGENIGDLGGLNVAYEAFKLTKQYKEGKLVDGFTPSQRFFLAWAQVWRMNALPEAEAQLIVTDSHSPGQFRTIGAPVNMQAWYDAFDVRPGDKLYKSPEERILIW